MTNTEIIFRAAVEGGIYTAEQAKAIITAAGELPLHTYAQWRAMGYQVRAGEHAVLICELWRFTSKAGKAAREEAAAEGKDPADDPHYYMATSRLFGLHQVAKVPRPMTRDEIRAHNKALADARRAEKLATA